MLDVDGAKLTADGEFEVVIHEPRVHAAIAHVLGRPYRVFALSARDPLPGDHAVAAR